MPFKRRPTQAIYRSKLYTQARAELLAAFVPGQPCCLCGHPILHTRRIEAQHSPGTTILIGLCHGTQHPCQVCGKRCNQVDGARRGRARQRIHRTINLRW